MTLVCIFLLFLQLLLFLAIGFAVLITIFLLLIYFISLLLIECMLEKLSENCHSSFKKGLLVFLDRIKAEIKVLFEFKLKIILELN